MYFNLNFYKRQFKQTFIVTICRKEAFYPIAAKIIKLKTTIV